ncbi:MAG: exo-alpha-sialidase [Thermoguttaceae bacterium]|nr:exo-alpha-sialidase [Thermoguttaceae bacterium]MBR5760205.1 exo-alpha-sialidase [Thermoguttaceae bacterium]
MKNPLAFLVFALFLTPLAATIAQESVDPLAPPDVLRPVPEKYSEENRVFQGIASLEVAADGGLWACWYSGGTGEDAQNYVLLAYSGDQGETWSKPIFAIDPAGIVRAFDSTLWSDPDGKLWIFWSQGEENKAIPESIWDGRVGVWAMTTSEPEKGVDAQWSAPRRLCNGIMMCKPIADSKGRWLFPVAIWRFDSKYKIDEKLRGANVYVSTDKGATLDNYGRVYVPAEVSTYDEHNIVEKKDGSFWILNRTLRGIGESHSTDGGMTWSEFQPSTIKHTSSRFFVRRLKSGALLLVKNGPIDQDVGRQQMTAFISEDDGQTWQGGLVLDERNQVSYPDGGQNADGTIFIIYDFERYDSKEIYVARFTEEDVKAGKIVSETGKLRLLVNKATGKR